MAGFWDDKRVFITGGNGFLGSHLVAALLEKGVKPVVLVYEDNPGGLFEERGYENKVTVIRGDIRDIALMKDIIKREKIDTIFHLAAQAIVDQALADPLETFEINIQGTWNLLDAATVGSGVERLIVASSDKAYGAHETLPYQEEVHHLKGGYPYEVSKTCADLLCQSFHHAFKVPVVVTRCGNLYGPGDLKMNRLIPSTISRLHGDTAPLIRDTDSSLRDYVYVEDAVEAYLMLAEQMDERFHGEAFNFSTNEPLSVGEAIAAMSEEMGKNIEPKVIETHGLEIRHQFASYDKAKRMLGWEPRHSFKEGLRKTIPWYVGYIERSDLREPVLQG